MGGLTIRIFAWVLIVLITQGVWSSVQAQDRMNGTAIREKIVGNTITIVTHNLERATGLVESNGEMRGKIGGEKFKGKWFIRNDSEICFDLPENKFDICRVAVDAGDSLNFFTTTGEPRGRAEILRGNPENF